MFRQRGGGGGGPGWFSGRSKWRCTRLYYYPVLMLVLVLVMVRVSNWNRKDMQAKWTNATFGAAVIGVLAIGHSNSNMLVPALQSMTGANKPPIPFYFVNGKFVKSPEDIFSLPWFSRLQEILRSFQNPAKLASVVFSDSKYLDSLLNWLISSQVKIKPPLGNLIVVSLDKIVFDMLDHRDIPSILVDPAMVLNANEDITKNKFAHIWIIRFVVLRMITHLGYDVISYDTDAILMKNLQPLLEKYQDYDIVGSAGTFPVPLSQLWGATICMGVVRFRSLNSELMWELMSKYNMNSWDDQSKLNYALKNCDIKWQASNNTSSSISTSPISGQCSLPPYQGLRVVILPYNVICRRQCNPNQDYFVAHPSSKKEGTAKIERAMGTRWWSLRKDWRNDSLVGDGIGSLKGIEWLATLVDTS